MNNDEYKLVAKLGNLKTIVQMLKAINFQEVTIIFLFQTLISTLHFFSSFLI